MQPLPFPQRLNELAKLLPQRWFRIPDRAFYHPVVTKYRESRVRFKTIHAGRRSYKTEIGKRKLIREIYENPGQRGFAGAPTREQAKRIFWKDLKSLSHEWFIKRHSESELFIEYVNGAELWVIGFDKPARFEGSPWNFGLITEAGNFKEQAINENIMPAIRDTGGWLDIEGVPEGRNHYYELSEYARTSGDPEWQDFAWKTAEVRDPKEVEKERARLDERTFRQEWEGSFESYEGRAYPYYDADTHRKKAGTLRVDPEVPLCVCCDFNLDPAVWILGQDTEDRTVFFEEIVQRRTDIWRMCAETKRRIEGHKHSKLVFYGDYQHGKTRSLSATLSSWEIIRQEFPHADFRIRSNPRIIDRRNAVNSRLRTADGRVHIAIDARCVELHKDFEQATAEMEEHDDQQGDRTHAVAAAGYMIDYEHPILHTEGVIY